MAVKYMGGKVDVSLNGVTIPSHFISDEGVTTTLTEGVREVATMAGTFSQPSGIYEEASVAVTFVLPDMNFLKNIFPEMYSASIDRPTVAGQTVVGGNTCTVRQNTPVVIHYSCEPNSDNDIYIPNAAIVATMELVQNATDPVTVEVTMNALPDDNGVIAQLGTGSLSGPTIWNPVTEEYEPVSSS